MSCNLVLAFGNETDGLALLALKDQLVDGSSAGALTSWNPSLHFCKWEGVRCGRKHKRVISLKLNGMKFGGSISPSIGNLSFLREVNLSDNGFQGNIPREFGQLRRLRCLNLSHNNLRGNIPRELSNCSILQSIDLNYNSLSGEIPSGFGGNDMNNLIRLSLSHNNLMGFIPASIGNLSSLGDLQLGENHLEGVISNVLGRLSNLETLYISGNSLSGQIPPLLSNISSLRYIGMGRNNLSGLLPPEIGNCSKLEVLDIAGDLDFLSSLRNCSLLNVLAIHENKLGGVLPHSVANLSTQLEYLYMGGNQISGSIPKDIGNLVKLTHIHIWDSFLTGDIPTSIGNLLNLGLFDLSANGLSGNIPSSIGNLSQLLYLYLNDNNFEGTIPLTLSKCKSMLIMDLSQNKLGGSIQDQLIAGFESLIILNLSQNTFTGVFPAGIANLKNLAKLSVDNNTFSGGIPKELGEIYSLTTLHMKGNYFQGSIPLSFGFLKDLEDLDLSHNNLSGTIIPVELQKLPVLVSLNLSFNRLEGEVPQEGVFKDISESSIVGNKGLCGGIPAIKLPKCINPEEKKAKKQGTFMSAKVIVVIIVSTSLASILVVLLVILCWRKCFGREREIITEASPPVGYPRVSYTELFRATNGFATSNYIGGGRFGSVYKGILHQQESPVAVKVLNLQNTGAIKSFTIECEALKRIRHRNLVKVITSCSGFDHHGSDFKALVLEFMPGGSLESWLHDHQYYLNFGLMLDIAIDVANALDYLHHQCEMLIVHRDLKPANILLDDYMVANVGDFGMAKLLSAAASNQGSQSATSSGIKGTIGYLAPEYGMGGLTSPEGDIYSYGILLLEMITGKRPTDNLFHEGLSLHNFCKMALPEQLEEIVDFRLLEQINEQNIDGETWECLVTFTKVGVACSVEVPTERMKIQDAITELLAIKAILDARN
ncbi:hypothetical protein PTKIN_Ptkin16aG0117700 [Pterospermum kingtungense]